MTPEGIIIIYYDRNPAQPVGCVEEGGHCDYYRELIGDLAPGQRKRIAVAGADYEVLASGDISLVRNLDVTPGGHTAQIPYSWAAGSPQHRCYQQELASRFSVGHHVMSLGSLQRIERCLSQIQK